MWLDLSLALTLAMLFEKDRSPFPIVMNHCVMYVQ